MFAEQQLPAGWVGGINDRKQIILTTTPESVRFLGEPVTPRMAEQSALAEEGWFPNIAKDGTPVYSVFSRVRSTGSTVVLNAPASVIDTPLRRSLALVLGGGLILGGLGMGTAMSLGGYIASPIGSLATIAQALGRGDRLASAPASSVWEVHAVGHALAESAALLQQRENQLRSALQVKEVLLKEVHHRVKNNLQIIASLLSLQSDSIRDPQALEVFQASQGRVRSIALVHETLYQSEDLAQVDFAQYITTLTAQLVRSYGGGMRGVALKAQTERVLLNIDTAIPCGLILHELLTNALKYAFPTGEPGEIQISLNATPGHVILSVQDSGVGFPEDLDFRHTDSLGLQLVCVLTQQLEGTIELARGGGTCFTLTFPLEHLVSRQSV